MDWQPQDLSRLLRTALDAWGEPANRWPVHVQALASVASTNTTLLAQAAQDPSPCVRVLVATTQTAGRGRHGRPWDARAGDSLTFSISVPQPAGGTSAASLAVAVALAEAFDPIHGPDGAGRDPNVLVKWPNDLWLRDAHAANGGRKCAGILIESTTAADGSGHRARTLVVGVGINLATSEAGPVDPVDPVDPTRSEPYGRAALAELPALAALQARDTWRGDLAAGAQPVPAAVWAFHRATSAVLQAVLGEARDGFAAAWQDRFNQRDALLGRRLVVLHATGSIAAGVAAKPLLEGEALGVDPQGQYLLRDDRGHLTPIASGEVSLRAAQASA
jgi:BirA family transcriptional regulator, biotin operon repressor / biotin---[acetyl-CoA-carboxylase] ligase